MDFLDQKHPYPDRLCEYRQAILKGDAFKVRDMQCKYPEEARFFAAIFSAVTRRLKWEKSHGMRDKVKLLGPTP